MTNPHEQPTQPEYVPPQGHPYQPHPYGQPTPPPHKRGLPTWAIVLLAVAGGLVLMCGIGAIATLAADEPGTTAAPESEPAESDPELDGKHEEKPVDEEPADKPEPEPEPDLTVAQEQAVIVVESYLANVGGFSRQGLIQQLEYEGFSNKDAKFAVEYVDPDWMEQAVIAAESYMETVGGFSRESLIDQLEYEGFTRKQAEHGADEVGL